MTFLMGTAPVWLKEKCDYFADQYSEVDRNDLRFENTDVISLIKVRSRILDSLFGLISLYHPQSIY